jgi:hypothetical protein
MYFFRGGRIVKKGTYWEPEKNVKIVLKDDDILPGNEKLIYFKLPECYLLIPVLLFGLVLSMFIPYGIGVVFFLLLCGVHKFLFSVLTEIEILAGKAIAYFTTAYRPNRAFFSGRLRKIKGNKKGNGKTNILEKSKNHNKK